MSRIVLISSLGLLAVACTPRRAREESAEPPPTVTLHGARLRSFEGETLVVSGRAEQVTYQRMTGEVQGSTVLVHLPRAPGASDAPVASASGVDIHAPRMEGSLASKQWTGLGGVVVRTGEGMVANTPRLTYDATARNAHGNEGLTVKGPDYRLSAERFALSLPDESYTFEGSVRTVLGAQRD
ncbi:hypothetical protein DRW03_27835 [Corallococcus sp. H22C18031201]|nr:hypothetical protein DRW03_27835 [Corallococcus sp. H22C18031201]